MSDLFPVIFVKQFPPENLAGRGFWNGFDELYTTHQMLVGCGAFLNVLFDLVHAQVRPRPGHDVGARGLAESENI